MTRLHRSASRTENRGKTTGQQPQTRAEENAEYKAFLRRKVFLNPTIWIIAVGNFFVYVVRFAVLDWGPTMLKEHLHMDISLAGWSVAAFEIAGIAGMLAAGWATGSAVRRAGSPNLCRLHVDGGPLAWPDSMPSTGKRRSP